MGNQIFNEVGLNPPSAGDLGALGATVLSLTDSTSSTHVLGEVVMISSLAGGSDTELKEVNLKYTEFEDVPAGAATSTGATSIARMFGVCLQDIAADGTGLVAVRGFVMALCEDAGTNINLGTASALTAMSGVGTIPGNLVSPADVGAGVYFKTIALYRGATAITTGPAVVVLRPVLFDGVAGFFSGEMP